MSCKATVLLSTLLYCCFCLPQGEASSIAVGSGVSQHGINKFRGKVAVVTGGASGIGYAIASKCIREGMNLLLSDINEPALRAAAGKLSQTYQCEVEYLATDVRSEQGMSELLNRCMEKFRGVNMFFNNAGVIGEPSKGVLDTPLSSWRWVLDTNVLGLIIGAKVFIEAMEKQGGDCHVINTASGAGLYSQHRPTMGPYVASKHCAVVLTQAMKTELEARKSNVQMHLLCPSIVATDLVPNSRYIASHHDRVANGEEAASTELDAVSQAFHQRLNADGMSPDTVAELTFQGVQAHRFFILTHPNITLKRIDARHQELVSSISEQPTTGF
mmetsp:Transcript_42606/g.87087  ORF Transcript_42606/g.87087 Transcript_42606/m.87087 type:complete len:329 (+) Transcript_42606:131-1117(+)|eukprot:CAMPEP_0181340682 /NCGR_PEP_ID=MMETSP1101-20121128/29984_1 /TAXON_ID=46948 /ORGANISM="Rhodomonas abbreviata, Strain Caron Lab Isolate" /LENGTH=328 /DNA_ID=CAMNT_0023451863 /DNA_START=125 /DNA_END=1111 /DNA_ORIENTATION=-